MQEKTYRSWWDQAPEGADDQRESIGTIALRRARLAVAMHLAASAGHAPQAPELRELAQLLEQQQ